MDFSGPSLHTLALVSLALHTACPGTCPLACCLFTARSRPVVTVSNALQTLSVAVTRGVHRPSFFCLMDDPAPTVQPELIAPGLGKRCPYCEHWAPDEPYDSPHTFHCDPRPWRVRSDCDTCLDDDQP